MQAAQRRPGRPIGSGCKQDDAYLAQVADRMLRDASLRPTTAMRRVMSASQTRWLPSPESVLRRWQRKWVKESVRFMQAAAASARPREAKPTARQSYDSIWPGAAVMAAARAVIDTPTMRIGRELAERMNVCGPLIPKIESLGIGKMMEAVKMSSGVLDHHRAITAQCQVPGSAIGDAFKALQTPGLREALAFTRVGRF